MDVDLEEWKNLSKEEKFGIATVQSSFKSRMSAVILKEYEDYKDEPRTVLNRKQNDGPSRQHDTIASKTKQVKGKKKRVRVASDWENYWGSNKKLQEEVKEKGADQCPIDHENLA